MREMRCEKRDEKWDERSERLEVGGGGERREKNGFEDGFLIAEKTVYKYRDIVYTANIKKL